MVPIPTSVHTILTTHPLFDESPFFGFQRPSVRSPVPMHDTAPADAAGPQHPDERLHGEVLQDRGGDTEFPNPPESGLAILVPRGVPRNDGSCAEPLAARSAQRDDGDDDSRGVEHVAEGCCFSATISRDLHMFRRHCQRLREKQCRMQKPRQQ